MKKTRIVFYLLFIPYILLLIEGVQNAFDGCVVGFFGDQTPIYGLDAFHWIVIVALMWYWYFWAICLIGQIALLIWEKVKNKGKIAVCIVSMIVVYIGCTLLGYGVSFLAV